jgi:PleD family two-component response regulator
VTNSSKEKEPNKKKPGLSGRILVVDDEPKVTHLLHEVLGATGYEVLAAFTGTCCGNGSARTA